MISFAFRFWAALDARLASLQTRRLPWLLGGLVAIVVALALRLPGYDGRPLWVDEMWRANLILRDGYFRSYFTAPDVYAALTAPLYAAVNRAISVIGGEPGILRLSSLLPGLVNVVLAMLIVRRAGGGLFLALAAALLFAANLDFIRYSNEFKPYVFEVTAHLCCFYIWLGIAQAGPSLKLRQLCLLGGVLMLAALSCANIVFILPAMGLLVLWQGWQSGPRLFVASLAMLSIVAALVLGLYALVWRHGSQADMLQYWADGFPASDRGHYIRFLLSRWGGIWRGAFTAAGIGHVVSILVSVATLGSVAAVYLRNGCSSHRVLPPPLLAEILLFYAITALVVTALNRFSLWPLGHLRPNLFIYGHVLVLTTAVIAAARLPRPSRILAIILILVLAAGMLRQRNFADISPPLERSDQVWSAFVDTGPAGIALAEQCRAGAVPVLADPAMGHALTFFTALDRSRHRATSLLSSPCADVKAFADVYAAPAAARTQFAAAAGSGRPFWILYSHLDSREIQLTRDLLAEYGRIETDQVFTGAGYFQVIPKPAR